MVYAGESKSDTGKAIMIAFVLSMIIELKLYSSKLLEFLLEKM